LGLHADADGPVARLEGRRAMSAGFAGDQREPGAAQMPGDSERLHRLCLTLAVTGTWRRTGRRKTPARPGVGSGYENRRADIVGEQALYSKTRNVTLTAARPKTLTIVSLEFASIRPLCMSRSLSTPGRPSNASLMRIFNSPTVVEHGTESRIRGLGISVEGERIRRVNTRLSSGLSEAMLSSCTVGGHHSEVSSKANKLRREKVVRARRSRGEAMHTTDSSGFLSVCPRLLLLLFNGKKEPAAASYRLAEATADSYKAACTRDLQNAFKLPFRDLTRESELIILFYEKLSSPLRRENISLFTSLCPDTYVRFQKLIASVTYSDVRVEYSYASFGWDSSAYMLP
jgi:hypothetical protein